MPAPQVIVDLVERFERNRDSYRSSAYNETQLRREFVDPFFETLGWDVNNKKGRAEAYKHVIHEDSIKIEGKARAPDYSFRIGSERKFFVETKRPGESIRTNATAAYQLRRYGWSAKLPVSILTDFEEFVVYDTRVRPKEGDKASTARIRIWTYDQFVDSWDEIAGIFSFDAIELGSFDKFVETAKSKRGTASVDDAFLEEIERWRDILARNIALRNSLSQRDLNFAVQRILDRIIFLRIAEDRGIEEYGRLRETSEAKEVYKGLQGLFERADERYNSGLFHFRKEKDRDEAPDRLTPGLTIDDRPLKDILAHLYYPESPYEFSVLPADILGQVYERFLGKVIRLGPSGRAIVEEKPEVRKAGGVYYTPTDIVEYIVENTVGKLVEGYKPGPKGGVSSLRILDPACGSGSFLLGAYEHLLRWHLAEYEKDLDKYRRYVAETRTGTLRLTTEERKRILLANIYGVDIDPQAVEVTKLSLLLKVLEGESEESIARQFAIFHERVLPDLSKNIRCGNSLISSDYYDRRQIGLLNEEELYRINAFDWSREFPQIMEAGGFDATIGNPPYVLLQTLDQPDVFEYLGKNYSTAKYKIDTYQVFFERALDLTKADGYLGYITPNSFLRNKHAEELRRILLNKSALQVVRLFDYPVFRGASVDTAVTITKKSGEPVPQNEVEILRSVSVNETKEVGRQVQKVWLDHPHLHFDLPGGDAIESALHRMESGVTLKAGGWDAYFGIQTYDRKVYVADQQKAAHWQPAIDGTQINRYSLAESEEWVDYRPDAIKSGGKQAIYTQRRIGVRQIGKVPIATILPAGLYSLNTIYNVYPKERVHPYTLEFILAILLSKAGQVFWVQRNFDQKRTFPKIKKAALLGVPLPRINFEKPAEREKHDRVVKLVERMLQLREQHSNATTGTQANLLKRQVATVEDQINRAVYELFGFSDAEIAAVENADGL
jgi:type I restriction-modification system DNA methylase subunit/predicted type IV restriction endonuclease